MSTEANKYNCRPKHEELYNPMNILLIIDYIEGLMTCSCYSPVYVHQYNVCVVMFIIHREITFFWRNITNYHPSC